MSPQENFLISDLLRSLSVPFWGETARVGRPTAKSIVRLCLMLTQFKSVTLLRSAEAAKQP